MSGPISGEDLPEGVVDPEAPLDDEPGESLADDAPLDEFVDPLAGVEPPQADDIPSADYVEQHLDVDEVEPPRRDD
ncbi:MULTISPECIES: hypothetical protein [unclassified Gordonia (in: high G+C Gram-positive bacteria)]|uniref:hypothetical protein n=1 Tax=unclassified Gordonia (in: high G+C Gram-positive bacteria) TaxID=2657482 RepID=UPI0007EA3B78|nr:MULTISPECIES: hypothetical protein [unclassified Gordonia (in: high G+C Gram-positive bacteria)]OBC05911.1 hypothetical protein A5785_11950 [Gordonia sp. 852002-50395_SCH5434458]OBC16939.1 hypothetical protein A5786_19345 [Gordonia sp. 852002-50816_SCH5313054-a]OBC19585.1 hypothetical protein A5788_08275 [Gordonia sp. 852002-50816_SCH5313054-c]